LQWLRAHLGLELPQRLRLPKGLAKPAGDVERPNVMPTPPDLFLRRKDLRQKPTFAAGESRKWIGPPRRQKTK
jgi:hypothetical protein